MADLSEVLSRIRPHTTSSLSNQKAPAILLQALESTFQEQNKDNSPTAYFAALLTTLDCTLQTQRSSGPSFGEGDVLPAELYLLSLVVPFVPQPVLRSNLTTVISLTAHLFPALVPHAPPLRSQLTIYNSMFLALDRSQLDAQGVRQAFASILHLSLDPRPKVRRKAAELIRDVLASPPTPLTRHPYAERVAEFITSSLSEVNTSALPKGKGKDSSADGTETGIHLLALLGPLITMLPPSNLPSIVSALLTFPRLGNPYLSRSAFTVLSQLVSASIEDDDNNVATQLPEIIDAIHFSSPIKTDTTQASAWMLVLANATVAYSAVNPSGCEREINKIWKSVWTFLESADTVTRKATAESLDLISKCFTPSMVKSAIEDKDNSILGKIILQCRKALDSLVFARSIPEVLSVISSITSRLHHRDGSRQSPTAAEILMASIIQKIGDLRTKKDFEYKESADSSLSIAMRVLGPEAILKILPLNLEPADRAAGGEPRAFILPLLAQPHPAPLGHFVSYFVPLTERMFDLQQTAESEGRTSEAKVWSVLVSQIWNGLPGYCYGTVDLQKALTLSFSQLLSQLVYSQVELRAPILKALKIMVDSNVALASTDESQTKNRPSFALEDPISPSEAAENVNFLKTQVESWLAVLFNVFGTVDRDRRRSVGDVISAWAGIADAEQITKAYAKVVELFKNNLKTSKHSRSGMNVDEDSGVTAMTQDLLLLLLPFLSPSDARALFDLCISPQVLEDRHTGVQKRGYKTLGKLIEGGLSVDAEVVISQLEGVVDGLAAAAKKDRLHLLSLLVTTIPNTALHLIPSLIPEAVLGAKEPSEKARQEAFDLVVAMGKKMKEGGVVKLKLLEDIDEDHPPETAANFEEYIKMVAGGLAGTTPHMISATITAVSRLVFEFKDEMSPSILNEIFTTLLVFLDSTNREIVKSALGFVKLALHTYPTEIVQKNLQPTIKTLLSWSHGNKNHFKLKVRYICERMMRKFGFDALLACVEGNEDGKKVLTNIKKRRDHARKKKHMVADEAGEEQYVAKPATGAAFEDVLYGSDSESEAGASDDDEAPPKSKKDNRVRGARLRIDDDEPMDLLEGAATHVTNARSNRRRKPGQDAARFKTDAQSGKMVVDDEDIDGDGGGGDGAAPAGDYVAGAAYRESLQSADGFTRGANGRVKFNKDTKKRRRENAEDEDIEMADAEGNHPGNKAKRRPLEKLGKEFKARRAGGDVKKGGVDPYAYVSLQQAAKKKSGHRITNKR